MSKDLTVGREKFFRDPIGTRAVEDLFGVHVVDVRPPFDRGAICMAYLQQLREDGKIDLDWTEEYGEPGYANPELGIILSNWNYFPRWFGDALERAGYELEWSDEWTIDWDGQQKAYRTSPDSHSWEPSFIYTDDGILTRDDDHADVIDYCAIESAKDPIRCVPSWVTDEDMFGAGYEPDGSEYPYESGWHPGQDDDPKKIAERAFKFGAKKMVFRKVENSQFYARFEAWVQKEEEHEEA